MFTLFIVCHKICFNKAINIKIYRLLFSSYVFATMSSSATSHTRLVIFVYRVVEEGSIPETSRNLFVGRNRQTIKNKKINIQLKIMFRKKTSVHKIRNSIFNLMVSEIFTLHPCISCLLALSKIRVCMA